MVRVAKVKERDVAQTRLWGSLVVSAPVSGKSEFD
jgi:hypothetical protein